MYFLVAAPAALLKPLQCGVELNHCLGQKLLQPQIVIFEHGHGFAQCALTRLREHRAGRFWGMVERLRSQGVALDERALRERAGSGALGRRNLAVMLENEGQVGSVREAFTRYLGDHGPVTLPKVRLPVRDAIALVCGAGGVAAWAHPSYDCTRESLAELSGWGLGAVEAEYPAHRAGRSRELREMAREFGLAVTGGSDCHGPEPAARAIGACSVSADELEELRRRARVE